MQFKVKNFIIRSGFSVYFQHNDYICKNMGFCIQDHILLNYKNQSLIVTVNTIDDNTLLKSGEVIISDEVIKFLNINFNDEISISMVPFNPSTTVIRKKIDGLSLTYEDYLMLYKSIKIREISDLHIASFVTACVSYELNEREVINSTRAMVDISQRLTWPYDIIVDKHCVGGVAGNRTTPIIVSIVAAYGLKIPKTSSRAITSPSGTADTMNVITNVNVDNIKDIVEKENGCFVFGGMINPIDDIIVKVEKVLGLNVDSQLIASIMSKKIAAGSNHILIDIPIGPEIKIKTKEQANYLHKCFDAVAEHYKLKIKVYFSDGSEPIGNGIGPALEIRDVLKILQNDPLKPKDLCDKALTLAGMIIDFIKPGEGYKIAKDILESGKAFEKFKAICSAQGAYKILPTALYQKTIYFNLDGVLKELSNKIIVRAAKLAGAPLSEASGLYLHKHVGEVYKKGDPFITIHSMSEDILQDVIIYLKESFKNIPIL